MVSPTISSRVVAVFADEQPLIDAWNASMFLAGPMPRDVSVQSWRPAALRIIEKAWNRPGTLAVFVPEARNWQPLSYDHHTWETRWLSIVDVICFWIPRDMTNLPGLNTNIEFGRWEGSGRVVLGSPPHAAHVSYLRQCATRQDAPVKDTLEDTLNAATNIIGDGAYRKAGHRDVPIQLWRTPAFQTWLTKQTTHNNELSGGQVLWAHNSGTDDSNYAFRACLTDRESGTCRSEIAIFGRANESV